MFLELSENLLEGKTFMIAPLKFFIAPLKNLYITKNISVEEKVRPLTFTKKFLTITKNSLW